MMQINALNAKELLIKINKRKQVEQRELERRVQEKTAELAQISARLKEEINLCQQK